ncbi:hypothetical protein T05_12631 [Trichinella murrelli]|uniref:CCHC-type domain-containing protein n=1 Tax=Trichinella murrelli TaxID=144512 RepID=A0A0V0TUG0_9BILA|nr:hypothetical protein T05_12631 [Trichinella murrelli]
MWNPGFPTWKCTSEPQTFRQSIGQLWCSTTRTQRTAAPEGIPPPEGAANSVLLLQFKSGRCLDAVKLLIYQAIWNAWKSGGNCQTRRAGGELDHQAHRKNIFGSHSDAETRAGNEAERTPDRRDPCDYKKNGIMARRQARSGHKNCWSCGRVGHFSQDCEMCNGRGRASGELQLRLKSDMLVDTGIAVTLAVMEFNQSSVVLWNVPKSTIWLEAASGTELVVTSACVMKIELDLTFTCEKSFPSDPVGVGFHAVPQLHPKSSHCMFVTL